MPIVGLEEVYAELNVDTPSGDDDAELQGFIDAVTTVIEEIVGPVDEVSLDEFYDGGGQAIILRTYPVLSVDAVTEYTPTATVLAAEPYGTSSYTASGYRLEPDIGRLTRTSGGNPVAFRAGSRNVRVQYTAGRAAVPPNVRNAALELIRMQWQPQQSGNLPGVGDEDAGGITVMGFFVPNRVVELLGPSARAKRVA